MIWKTLSLSVLVVTAACGQPSEQVEAKSEAKATVVEAASKAKEAAPPKQPSKPVQRKLAIQGMSCKGCAATVRTALKSVEGVTDATVAFETGEAVITCDESVTAAALVDKVENYELGGVKQSYTAKEILP